MKRGAMMRRVLLSVLALAVPALAVSGDGEARLAALLRGRTPGPPRACIPLQRDPESHVIDRIGVVYDVGTTRYVSRFKDGCDALTSNARITTRTPGTQLCEGEIAEVETNTPPVVPVGSCIYGPFTPYRR